MTELTLAHILQCISGELDDASVLGRIITGIAPSAVAGPHEITFQSNPKYWKDLKQTRAAAVITAERIPDLAIPQILHRNPYAAMAKAALLFYEERHDYAGISPQAFIHPDATVHESCTVYPFAFIEAGVKVGPRSVVYPYVMLHHGVEIGADTVLYAHVVVMRDCRIGSRCRLFPGVVIGADGFGFAPSAEGMIKIPQVGRAVIEDDVEIQALSAVDRGAFGDTVIGQGTKIDDLVLVAHGARIGKHSMLAGNSQIGGSTEIGERFILGGQGAVGPSLKIPANVIGGPLVGINSSLDEPGTYMGFPAQKIQEWRRQSIAAKKLPEALSQIRDLKRELAELRALIERPLPSTRDDKPAATGAERSQPP